MTDLEIGNVVETCFHSNTSLPDAGSVPVANNLVPVRLASHVLP